MSCGLSKNKVNFKVNIVKKKLKLYGFPPHKILTLISYHKNYSQTPKS